MDTLQGYTPIPHPFPLLSMTYKTTKKQEDTITVNYPIQNNCLFLNKKTKEHFLDVTDYSQSKI